MSRHWAPMFADPPFNVPVEGHVSGLGKVKHTNFAMASACPAAQDWGRAAIRLAIAAIARASPA